MKSIRRIYFYLVSFISVLTLIWGITNLLRSITSQQVAGDQSTILSAGLAQIIVSIPIFLLHWLIVQRDARNSEEEQNSLIRAIYLYGILLSSLIPVVQNVIALSNRLLLQGARLNTGRAIFGANQTLTDNLIAIAVNLLLAVYFFRVIQSDWISSTENANLLDLKRLYRYIWMLYSLGLTIFGVQKTIVFILTWQQAIGSGSKEQFTNALTLLIVGTPLWLYWWRSIQSSVTDYQERHSILRRVILYALTLGSTVTLAVNTGWIIYWLLRTLFGAQNTIEDLLAIMSLPISLAITFGVLRAYYSRILRGDISAEADVTKQAAMHRLYRYILSALGLGGLIFGASGVIGYVIDVLTISTLTWLDKSNVLASSLAVLTVGFVLWIVYWQLANHEAQLAGLEGDHARRSLSRKIYLYFTIFSCVIGTMASAGFLIYSVLQSIFGSTGQNVLNEVLQNTRLILIFAAFLVYHLSSLNRDNRELSRFLVEKQTAFEVVAILDPQSGMGKGLLKAFQRFSSGIPLHFIHSDLANAESIKDASAVVLETSHLETGDSRITRLLENFSGTVIVLQSPVGRFLWISLANKEADMMKGCALAVRSLAEGQEVKPVSSSSPWLIISYLVAALFGLQILAVVISTLFNGL
jgi:hypothetical protein